MAYQLRINKDCLDRFVLTDSQGNVFMRGEKRGNKASFFDSISELNYDKGAEYHLHFLNDDWIIRRTFYEERKEYTVFSNRTLFHGEITAFFEQSRPCIKFSDRESKLRIELNDSKTLEIPGKGYVMLMPQGFTVYRAFRLEPRTEKDLPILSVIAIYYWDVFIKTGKR